MDRLKDKVALITGGAKGIGKASAELFVKEGCKVVLTDVDDASGQKVADALGENCVFMHQDVAKEDEWKHIIAKTLETFGHLDVVFNNAGIAVFENPEETTLETWHKVLGIDLDGVMLGTKLGIKAMKNNPNGGSIINVSSIAGLIGIPNLFAYNAAKGGVRMMTKSAALYCAQQNYNIRVNSIHPGYIDTPLVDKAGEDLKNDALKQELIKLHPMGRLGTAEEIAQLALFLATDESSFSTGSEFTADGGYTAQ